MATYIGYVVKGDSNPCKVFIPALSGMPSFQMAKCFGTNAGGWDVSIYGKMLQGAHECYMSSECAPTASNYFDTGNGYTTIEENQKYLNSKTAKVVTGDNIARNTAFSPNDYYYVQSPYFYPAANNLRTYIPSSVNGMKMSSYTNIPGGTFTTMRVGSKVLVDFPDGSGIGYIVKQLPDADDYKYSNPDILKGV